MHVPESPQNEAHSTEAAAEPEQRNWGRLERPGTRRRLMTELARGEKTQAQLAREYGVVESSMTEFKQRHRDRIDEIARDIDNEFSGLWVTQKTERLDEMQTLYEGITSGEITDLDQVKTRLDVLRKAAEELGQIPNRTTIDLAQPVEVRIVGADDV